MLLAPPASHAPPGISAAAIALVLAIVAALYIGACVIWPFSACTRCDGAGKHRSPSGKAWRTCRRCAGSGARVRAGRKAWTALTKRHDAATKADRSTRKHLR